MTPFSLLTVLMSISITISKCVHIYIGAKCRFFIMLKRMNSFQIINLVRICSQSIFQNIYSGFILLLLILMTRKMLTRNHKLENIFLGIISLCHFVFNLPIDEEITLMTSSKLESFCYEIFLLQKLYIT